LDNADDLQVLVPADPPRLTAGAATILLEILIEARGDGQEVTRDDSPPA
jgi:threonine dehydratase